MDKNNILKRTDFKRTSLTRHNGELLFPYKECTIFYRPGHNANGKYGVSGTITFHCRTNGKDYWDYDADWYHFKAINTQEKEKGYGGKSFKTLKDLNRGIGEFIADFDNIAVGYGTVLYNVYDRIKTGTAIFIESDELTEEQREKFPDLYEK